jgi:tetratricopeptide (TPR) repeat protein
VDGRHRLRRLRPDRELESPGFRPEHFLEAFEPGPGAEDFTEWADRMRVELRTTAVRLLEQRGDQAEEEDDWERALKLGKRAVEIEPVGEQGHRRMMRAYAALGERVQALRHYRALVKWLADEMDSEPADETQALFERLRADEGEREDGEEEDVDPQPPRPFPSPPPEPAPKTEPDAQTEPGAQKEAEAGSDTAAEPGTPPLAPAGGDEDCDEEGGPQEVALCVLAAIALVALLLMLLRVPLLDSYPPEPLAGHGENLRLGDGELYLAFGDTLWRYPDPETHFACTGSQEGIARRVDQLPRRPRKELPSVTAHPWLQGGAPVVSDHPSDKTAYVVVGCILAGIPDRPTFEAIFGRAEWERLREVPDSVLRALPRTSVARPLPVRPAGTLLRGEDGATRWVVWHGGALAVDPRLLAGHCRSLDEALRVSADELRYYRTWASLPPAAWPCGPERGR